MNQVSPFTIGRRLMKEVKGWKQVQLLQRSIGDVVMSHCVDKLRELAGEASESFQSTSVCMR
jgi:hypothetical protein